MTNPFQPIYDECNAGNSQQKYESLPAFPRLIDLEVTNTCNFRCLMCPTGNYSQHRKAGFMAEETYYKLVEECRPHGTALRYIGWGEPLTHPHIVDFIRAASDANLLTHLNTNGSKMTEEMARALIDAGLKSIKFSFQGVDTKSYAEMRNIDYFDEL
ncbi:MAG: radical SAM protein, partial [Rickettsiales bacterium]